MRIALVCGLLCSFLINGNINRLNMLWLPMIYFSALGCHVIFQKLGNWAPIPIAGMLVCFAVFIFSYCDSFAGKGNAYYFPGLGDAILAAEAMDADSIYVTDRVNQPYIFVLFYNEVSPAEFVSSVEYVDPDAAFRKVKHFGRYTFDEPKPGALLVLHRSEVVDREILTEYGSFAVCR